MCPQLKENISILMAGTPLVMFREKFRGIFTSSSQKKVEGSVVIEIFKLQAIANSFREC